MAYRGLEQWQRDVNANMKELGVRQFWDVEDFAAFTGKGKLKDLHFLYFLTLLKIDFPRIKGLHPTTLYNHRGYPPVDMTTSDFFLQPCHSGGDHWSVLTNQGIDYNDRPTHVKVYDSLILFSYGSKNSCDVPAAIEWQSAQKI